MSDFQSLITNSSAKVSVFLPHNDGVQQGAGYGYTIWDKPKNATMAYILAIAGGGAGGAGFSGVASSARGGGGGGGSGGLSKIIVPLFLLPDQLYIMVGAGGAFVRYVNIPWTRSTTTVTCTLANHRLYAGTHQVFASSDLTAIPLATYAVTIATANTFTFTVTDTGGASGTLSMAVAFFGCASRVTIHPPVLPTATAPVGSTVLYCNGGNQALHGSSTAGGTGGTAGGVATQANTLFGDRIGVVGSYVAGAAGGNGGAQTGAVGADTIAMTTGIFCGGAGGGGTTSANFAGGNVVDNTAALTNLLNGISWSRSGTAFTATSSKHNLYNQSVTIYYTSDASAITVGTFAITVTGTDTFTFTATNGGASSGTMSVVASFIKVPGGAAGSNNGNPGLSNNGGQIGDTMGLSGTGGSGGGSSNSSVGGHGGSGGLGSGGGGGGGGTTSGDGGHGGDGMVMIIAW
jgi:hypothetical protein